jgi:putative resolvase
MITRPQTNLVRVGVAARRLGLHPMTVRRWLKSGKIASVQIGREARIPVTEIERLLGEQPGGVVALYARVSGHDHKPTLDTQIEVLKVWAAKERPGRDTLAISDIGSGLHAERKGLLKVIKLAQERKIVEVVVTYKDRLTRFGFEYLQALFLTCGVRLTVLNAEEETTPEKELTDDLIAIITSFSGRLYGLRSHKQKELVKCAKTALKS